MAKVLWLFMAPSDIGVLDLRYEFPADDGFGVPGRPGPRRILSGCPQT